MGSGLIKLVLRDGLGRREVEGRGLVEVELGLGRTPGRGHPGRPMGQVEVEEDVPYGGGEGDERYDPHLTAAGRAQEREHLVDASHEPGQSLEQLKGSEAKFLATVHIGLGEPVNQASVR